MFGVRPEELGGFPKSIFEADDPNLVGVQPTRHGPGGLVAVRHRQVARCCWMLKLNVKQSSLPKCTLPKCMLRENAPCLDVTELSTLWATPDNK